MPWTLIKLRPKGYLVQDVILLNGLGFLWLPGVASFFQVQFNVITKSTN